MGEPLMKFTILEAASHRNGVSGEGFYVGLVHDHGINRKLLITWFPQYDDGEGEVLAKFQSRIAVIDPVEAATGNVYMHPTNGQPGNNAWRGEYYGAAVRAIRERVNTDYDTFLARLSDSAPLTKETR